MESLLEEIIENRNRLLLDLKTQFMELKNDFKYLNPNYSSIGSQYKYYDVIKFIEANKYLISTHLFELCNSYISKLKTAINLKYSSSNDSNSLSKEFDLILHDIDNEISKYI